MARTADQVKTIIENAASDLRSVARELEDITYRDVGSINEDTTFAHKLRCCFSADRREVDSFIVALMKHFNCDETAAVYENMTQ